MNKTTLPTINNSPLSEATKGWDILKYTRNVAFVISALVAWNTANWTILTAEHIRGPVFDAYIYWTANGIAANWSDIHDLLLQDASTWSIYTASARLNPASTFSNETKDFIVTYKWLNGEDLSMSLDFTWSSTLDRFGLISTFSDSNGWAMEITQYSNAFLIENGVNSSKFHVDWPSSSVPEPESIALVWVALAGLAAVRRRKPRGESPEVSPSPSDTDKA